MSKSSILTRFRGNFNLLQKLENSFLKTLKLWRKVYLEVNKSVSKFNHKNNKG